MFQTINTIEISSLRLDEIQGTGENACTLETVRDNIAFLLEQTRWSVQKTKDGLRATALSTETPLSPTLSGVIGNLALQSAKLVIDGKEIRPDTEEFRKFLPCIR